MALGVVSASNKNEYQEYFFGGGGGGLKVAGAYGSDSFSTFMCRLCWNLGILNSWNPQEPVQACNCIALPLPLPLPVELTVLFQTPIFFATNVFKILHY